MSSIVKNITQTPPTIINMPPDHDNTSSNAHTSPEASGIVSPQDIILSIEESLSENKESKKNYEQKEAKHKATNACITNFNMASITGINIWKNITTHLAADTSSAARNVGYGLTVPGIVVSVMNIACEYYNYQRIANGQPALPMKGDSIGNVVHALLERCGYPEEDARRRAHLVSLGTIALLNGGAMVANAFIPDAFSTAVNGLSTGLPLLKGVAEIGLVGVNCEKEKIGPKLKVIDQNIVDMTVQIAVEKKDQEIDALKEKYQREMMEMLEILEPKSETKQRFDLSTRV